MSTKSQIDHYRTFGFLVLRGGLEPKTLRRLEDEVERALRDGFGDLFEERPESGGGITGLYLPAMSVERTPVSVELVDRFQPLAEQLLGRPAFPEYAQEILYFGEAWWHDDVGPPVPAVKVAAYLQQLRADNGALRVLPASQHAPVDVLKALHRMDAHAVPCHVIETEPGDVILFDGHLWHAALNGRDRRQWTVSFFGMPRDDREREGLARLVAEWYDWGQNVCHDQERYPWYDRAWLDDPRRAEVVARMREVGLLDDAATCPNGQPGLRDT